MGARRREASARPISVRPPLIELRLLASGQPSMTRTTSILLWLAIATSGCTEELVSLRGEPSPVLVSSRGQQGGGVSVTQPSSTATSVENSAVSDPTSAAPTHEAPSIPTTKNAAVEPTPTGHTSRDDGAARSNATGVKRRARIPHSPAMFVVEPRSRCSEGGNCKALDHDYGGARCVEPVRSRTRPLTTSRANSAANPQSAA
ncbi:MAG: hypothetical protein ACI9OJ_006007 [Myxococcota bacterium]|jgi:hypothetical protein